MKLSENRVFALVWRIAGLLIGLFGLITMLVLSSGSMGVKMLGFFTIQSNIFVLVLFAALIVLSTIQIVKSGTKGEVACVPQVVQLAIVFFITITGVVYWTLLSWQSFDMGGNAGQIPKAVKVLHEISNVIVHGVVPVFAVIDWLLFMPHGKLTKKAAIWWLSYPIAYAIFIFVRAEVGGEFFTGTRYPYPFIDVDKLGWGVVAVIVVVLAFAFYGLGLLYIYLDNKLAEKIKKRAVIGGATGAAASAVAANADVVGEAIATEKIAEENSEDDKK